MTATERKRIEAKIEADGEKTRRVICERFERMERLIVGYWLTRQGGDETVEEIIEQFISEALDVPGDEKD